eukprot:2922917-Lingulodinium_polyedra.AAC.1
MPDFIGGRAALSSTPPARAGSTRPYTTALAKGPQRDPGPPGLLSTAVCVAARCLTRRTTQSGQGAAITCTS